MQQKLHDFVESVSSWGLPDFLYRKSALTMNKETIMQLWVMWSSYPLLLKKTWQSYILRPVGLTVTAPHHFHIETGSSSWIRVQISSIPPRTIKPKVRWVGEIIFLLSLLLEEVASWMHSKEKKLGYKKGRKWEWPFYLPAAGEEQKKRDSSEFLALSKRSLMDGEGGPFFLPQWTVLYLSN